MRIEEAYRQQQEEELNRQRELELQQQRERDREAKERAASLASNSASSGPRSAVSRLGVGRGTRGTAVPGTRGSARGRGKPRSSSLYLNDTDALWCSRQRSRENCKLIRTGYDDWKHIRDTKTIRIIRKRQEQRIRSTKNSSIMIFPDRDCCIPNSIIFDFACQAWCRLLVSRIAESQTTGQHGVPKTISICRTFTDNHLQDHLDL